MKNIVIPILASLALGSSAKVAKASQPLEALLPADTLLVVAAPDYAAAKKHFKAGALGQFWDSSEVKPFRNKLTDGLEANVLDKIEEELAIELETFEELASGGVALALVAGESKEPGLLLLLDAGRKSFTLRRALSRMKRELKKDDRKVSESEIGGIDFTTVSNTDSIERVHIGRVGSQLIVGTATEQIEGVLARLEGKGSGPLTSNAAFAADQSTLLKEADYYIWANLGQVIPQLLDNVPDGAELGIDFGEVLGSLGINSLGTFSMTYDEHDDGAHFDIFIGLPEANRNGLFSLLETKRIDASPPPFVPIDVGSFIRWRVNMNAGWKNLEKLLLEMSPDVANMIEFTVGLLGKDKDPNFDFKKSFLNNFGDDLILYQMPPTSNSLNDLGYSPMVALIQSPDPAKLIQGVGAVPGILPPPLNEAALKPRKLGEHSAQSFGILELPDPSTGELVESEMLFAVKDGYMALSNSANVLQSLLDGNTQSPLAKRTRLTKAAAAVGGMSSGIFGYQNDRTMVLSVMDTLRANAGQFDMIFGMIPMGELDDFNLGNWLDFSLLPQGEKIAKYFDITVYGAKADARGVNLKMFSPRPPNLKR